jgi:hypothetical protein
VDISQDGAIQNFANAVGSKIDPSANNQFTEICGVDLHAWESNGGLAKKIINFWPTRMGTGFDIGVASRSDGRRKTLGAEKIKRYLEEEFRRLDVLAKMIEAETTCQINRAAPMAIMVDREIDLSNPLESTRYKEVVSIRSIDCKSLTPVRPNVEIFGDLHPIDHSEIEQYSSNSARGSRIHASRILALQGEKLRSAKGETAERNWGRPLIGMAVAHAVMQYEAALNNAGNILAGKNTPTLCIEGMTVKLMADTDGEYAMSLARTLKILQATGGVLNCRIIDKNEMSLEMLERNLAGVVDVVDRFKDQVLVHSPNIPESYLFGRVRTGGLSKIGDDEAKQVNAVADQLFRSRWSPILSKLVKAILGGSNCPVANYDPELIVVDRVSGYSLDPDTKAKIRASVIESDTKMIANGSMTPQESRSRMTGTESFSDNLALEAEAETTS